MKLKYTLRRITLSMVLCLFLTNLGVAQSEPSSNQPVLEVVHVSCLTAGCGESHTWRSYPDGTVVFESNRLNGTKAGRGRRVLIKVEAKLYPDELGELLRLAEKSDFLKASPEYLTARVIDAGSFVKITYRKEKFEKRVTVYNYLIADEAEKAELPLSLVKIIELSGQIQLLFI